MVFNIKLKRFIILSIFSILISIALISCEKEDVKSKESDGSVKETMNSMNLRIILNESQFVYYASA